MSDYYGAATLEDWLKEEVFAVQCPIPADVVARFEEWREGVERNIESWMESDDGDGNNLSWRGWGRGFNAISDEDTARFDALVVELRPRVLSQVSGNEEAPTRQSPVRIYGESEFSTQEGRMNAGIERMRNILSGLDAPEAVTEDDAFPDVQDNSNLTGVEWFRKLRDLIINEKNSQALAMLDGLPDCLKDLKDIGQTHVVVPAPGHMTEDMIDASRSLLLYTDSFSTHDAAYIRELICKRGWTQRHLPEWFRTYEGHLTKAARAALAYHLTVQAAVTPPAPEEKHFAKASKQPRPGEQRLWITLRDTNSTKELCFGWAYETNILSNKAEVLDIQINRHQLPEDWRLYFKKQAVEVSARVTKGEDKLYRIDSHKARLGVKAGFAPWIEIDIEDGVERYKLEQQG